MLQKFVTAVYNQALYMTTMNITRLISLSIIDHLLTLSISCSKVITIKSIYIMKILGSKYLIYSLLSNLSLTVIPARNAKQRCSLLYEVYHMNIWFIHSLHM